MNLMGTNALAEDTADITPYDIQSLTELAQDGDANAQVDLAMAYHEGSGELPKDDAKAVEWFRKAAEHGNFEAQYNLGIAYYHGFGIKKDLTQAVHWFEKAAQQGYADAQYILAAAYQNGVGGVPKDLVQADMWLGLAEAQGNKEAARERLQIETMMSDADIAQAQLLIAAHPMQSTIP